MNDTDVRTTLLPQLQRLGITSPEDSVNCLGANPMQLVDRVVVHLDGKMASGTPDQICSVFADATDKVTLLDTLIREGMIVSESRES